MTISLAQAIATAPLACRAMLEAGSGKGRYATAEWQSIVADKAVHPDYAGTVLRKVTVATVRTGVEYRNLAQNADVETGALRWGTWVVYPWIITHKGEYYIRVYMASNRNESHARTTYYVDGTKVTRGAYGAYLKPSKPRDHTSDPDVFTYTIKACNILAINGTRFD